MSERGDKIAAAYKQLAESSGGKLLLDWINESAPERRRNASRLEPTPAWGELKFADGLEEVKKHIIQMGSLTDIK